MDAGMPMEGHRTEIRRKGGDMASVHDVAAYILDRKGAMSTWKLQKLVYYSQAWHLVWDEEPLFKARIEAWANGPVVRELYRGHRGQYTVSAWEGEPSNLTDSERETIDIALRDYGGLSGRTLSHLTHMEAPWREARKGLEPTAQSQRRITDQSMHDYYTAVDADEDAGPVADWEDIDY